MPLISTLAGVAAKAYGFIMAAAELIIGKTWTAGGTPVAALNLSGGGLGRSLGFGNGYFFGVQANGSAWVYTANGVTWSTGTTPPSPSLVTGAVTYGNGYWLIVYYDENKVAYTTSINGSWTTNSSGITWDRFRVAMFGNNTFVIIAGGNTTAGQDSQVVNYKTTAPSGSWSSGSMPSTAAWSAGVYGDKFVVIATQSGGANTDKAAYSTNGSSWTASTLPSSQYWISVDYNATAGKYVAVSNGTAGAYSTNGTSWTAMTMPASGYWHLGSAGKNFVAVANGTTTAATSSDGITWTLRTLPSSQLTYVAGNTDRAVACSTFGYNPSSSAYSIG
jgi:hypothetical protein